MMLSALCTPIISAEQQERLLAVDNVSHRNKNLALVFCADWGRPSNFWVVRQLRRVTAFFFFHTLRT